MQEKKSTNAMVDPKLLLQETCLRLKRLKDGRKTAAFAAAATLAEKGVPPGAIRNSLQEALGTSYASHIERGLKQGGNGSGKGVKMDPPVYPPEIESIWNMLPEFLPGDVEGPMPMCEARNWLKKRCVWERRDLVRYVSTNLELPRWARYGKKSWSDRTSKYRVAIPAYDLDGVMRSIKVRRYTEKGGIKCSHTNPEPAGPKELGPVGFDLRDLIFGQLPTEPAELYVCEGSMDWLSLKTKFPDKYAIGVFMGSPLKEIARRIPAGTKVHLAFQNNAVSQRMKKEFVKAVKMR